MNDKTGGSALKGLVISIAIFVLLIATLIAYVKINSYITGLNFKASYEALPKIEKCELVNEDFSGGNYITDGSIGQYPHYDFELKCNLNMNKDVFKGYVDDFYAKNINGELHSDPYNGNYYVLKNHPVHINPYQGTDKTNGIRIMVSP